MTYDADNVFARILRGEIPCETVMEGEHVLAFRDVNPQTPTHVLVIPKGAYETLDDFSERASEAEIVELVRTLGKLTRELGIAEDGYRVLSNAGRHGEQEVAHFHVHLFGGADLGPMISPPGAG